MFKWIIKLIVIALIFIGIKNWGIFTGYYVADYTWAGITAVVLSVLNNTVRPILKFLAVPITCLTMGLFLLVINGATIYITDKLLGDKFEVGSFINAMIIAVFVSIGSLIVENIMSDKD